MEPSDSTFEQNPPTQPLVTDTHPTPVAASARQTVPRRRALLSDDDNVTPDRAVTPAATPAATSYIVKTNRPANQRRGKPILWLLGLIFIGNLLLLGAFAAWYYNTINDQIESRLGSLPSRPAQQPTGPAPKDASTLPASADSAALQDKVADLQAQLQAMQKRLADTEQSTKSLASRAQQSSGAAAPSAVPAASTTSSSAPLTDDLLLLKERNRLTSYADEAIATAARAPYTQLWKSIDDPRLISLAHATRAEILRVQNYYLSGSRLDRFDIPVADYYPDSAALRDTQLSDEQLIRLLGNPQHPWQVRLKSANLLGLRRSTVVGDALVKAIKSDDNLDVVKEATFSFEQLTGYRAQLFESESLEAWWKQYNETPPPATPAPAPAGEDKPAAKQDESKDKPTEGNDSKPKTKTSPAKKSEAEKGKDNSKVKEKKASTSKEPPLPELILPVEKP